jgi:hypothetical protein
MRRVEVPRRQNRLSRSARLAGGGRGGRTGSSSVAQISGNKKAIHERGICYRNLCESLPSFGTLRKCELLHSLKHCSTLFRESAFAILPQHV